MSRVVFRDQTVGEDVDVELAPERPLERSQSEEARVRKHLLKSERTLTPTRRVTQQGVRRPNKLLPGWDQPTNQINQTTVFLKTYLRNQGTLKPYFVQLPVYKYS